MPPQKALERDHSSDALRGADRRYRPRTPLDVLANRFLEGYPYLCRAADISAEGIRLYRLIEPSPQPLFCGLQFQLPGCQEIISASGEVVFEDEASRAIGIRFTHLSKDASAAIEDYLLRTHAG
jgi:PilZ domain